MIRADSIRVDGKGEAIIHEVNYKTEHSSTEETDTQQIKDLVKEVEALELKRSTVGDLQAIYKCRLNSLDDLVKNVRPERQTEFPNANRFLQLGQVTLASKDTPEMVRFDESAEETLEKFYGYHERKSIELTTRIRSSEIEVRLMNDQVNKIRAQINELRIDGTQKR